MGSSGDVLGEILRKALEEERLHFRAMLSSVLHCSIGKCFGLDNVLRLWFRGSQVIQPPNEGISAKFRETYVHAKKDRNSA